jgi:hypothetical protein
MVSATARKAPPERDASGITRLSLVCLVLATAAVIVLAFLWSAPRGITGAKPKSSGVSEGSAAALLNAEEEESARVGVASVVEETEPEPRATKRLPGIAEICGRFVDGQGQPVEGVGLHLAECSEDRGAPASLEVVASASGDLEQASEPDGSFSLLFAPRLGATYCLSATASGMPELRWRWNDLEAGRREDLGEIEWIRGGSITGRLLDQRGQPILGQAWTVKARHPWPGSVHAQEPNEPECVADADSGTFRLERAPIGRCRLDVDFGGTSSFEGPVLEVRAGEIAQADIVCPIADWTATIGVIPSCPPFVGVGRKVESVFARTGDSALEASRPTIETGCFRFEDVGAGEHTIWIEDDLFLPWSLAGVRGGALVEAALKGSASVRLSVSDAASGSLLEGYSVHAQLDEDGWQNTPVSLVKPASVMTEGGVVDGLLPILQTLIVSCPGYADAYVRHLSLLHGEVRALDVPMSPGSTVAGVVVQEHRSEPQQPITVRLVPLRLAGYGKIALLERVDSSELRTTQADSVSGRFSFERVAQGDYAIQAARSLTVHSPIDEISVEEGASVELELHLPSETTLKGRVLAPSGTDLRSLHLFMVPDSFVGLNEYGIVPSQSWQRRLRVPIAADGSYESGPLPSDTLTVQLGTPDICVPMGYDSRSMTIGKKVDLGQVVLQPGAENVKDFDITDLLPGTVRVHANVQGETATDLIVELCRIGGSGGNTYLVTAAGAPLGRDDSALLGPLVPGDYQVVIRALEQTWQWVAPSPARVVAGREIDFACDVQLVRGEAQLRWEASGEPCTRGSLHVWPDSPGPRSRGILTDSDATGTVHLELPPGRYAVTFRANDDNRSGRFPKTLFEWPLPDSANGAIFVQRME